ncbi:hypothetical protein MSAN_00520000 [Mycena sanguinolenta]|uniref:MYND-type domain-containing protein n=1 Tax=Mycena sanguinolenta TaxID=230812 RepID=A0A8H7DH96_9AGAR|nr:hypothetical protein MSAN_00520000 [Mycena sanguinolenta]
MLALLLTVLALAVPVLIYAKYSVFKTTPLSHDTEEPLENDTSPSGVKSENLGQTRMNLEATPATEPDTTSTQVSLRGDPTVQPQSLATRRPVPAALPVDESTDSITPYERRMLEAMNSSVSEQFLYIQQMAKKFGDAVNAGDVTTQREIRLSVGTTCSYAKCGKPCLDASREKWTPKRCSGCQSNYYCSKECQKADWKPISGRSTKEPSVYHKDWCKVIRVRDFIQPWQCLREINYNHSGATKDEYMPQLPYYQAQVSQFPWGRIERDGTFSHKFLQARFGVLDSDYRKAGFWAIPERINPHDNSDDPVFSRSAQPFRHSNKTNLKGYAHGAMMLALEEWPSDVEWWKLQDEVLIPHYFFTDQFPPPVRPRPGQVKDWKSWYDWRGLSFESPATVLMDHILTTYYLLTETLKVVDLQRGSKERQVVDIHYLGAETELNYLPLFSELALLLPNTHINLTIFSPATHSLLEHAKQRYPRSIAAREGAIWGVHRPATHRRRLHRNIALSRPPNTAGCPSVAAATVQGSLVALNAGILSYSTWYEVVSCATMGNIPFACTDYAQQSVQMIADHIPEWLNEASRSFSPGEAMHQELVRQRTRPVTVNPFHRPGQRPISQVRSPNLGNGFICRLVGPE